MAVIKPELLSNWKMRNLLFQLKKSALPIAENLQGCVALSLLVRLWVHCETSKVWKFNNMSPEKLAAICDWPYDARLLHKILRNSGFLEIQGRLLVVHEWEIHNAQLIACWNRARFGNLGGRPKVLTGNPQGSTDKPDTWDGISGSTSPNGEEETLDSLQAANPQRPPPKKRSTLPIQLVDAQFINDMKKIYRPEHVDRAVASCKTWLLTPKGRDKAFTKRRLMTFLRDAEPLSGDEGREKRIREEVEGWRSLLSEADPEMHLPQFWGQLSDQQQRYARQLKRISSAT